MNQRSASFPWTKTITISPHNWPRPSHAASARQQLFLPSIQTFALADTVPFHLTLCSSIRSLRELLPPDCSLMQTDGRQHNLSKAEEFRMLLADAPIRVTIARQIVVDVGGRRRVRTFPCAIGKLWPVPPAGGAVAAEYDYHYKIGTAAGNGCKRPGAKAGPGGKRRADSSDTIEMDGIDLDAEACLDWQGEIKPWAEVTAGGFNTSCLMVKVSILLDDWCAAAFGLLVL